MDNFEWDDTYDPAPKDDYIDDEVYQTYQDLTSDLPEQPLDPGASTSKKPQISDDVWNLRALNTAVNQLYTDA